MRFIGYAIGYAIILLLTVAACGVPAGDTDDEARLIIAHRGASGYLPEHTLAAKAMAYAQGADFIEQDLVMTKDDVVVVLHDHHLDTVTDVQAVFPDRAREDGRYYVVDFTLGELQQLSVFERFSSEGGRKIPVFPHRFPLGKSSFGIHTFADEIELIQGLNQSTGTSVGIYPEIKSPRFHRDEGKDISVAVLKILRTYGYVDSTALAFLQCFDPTELLRIHGELMPAMDMRTPLVQLLGTSSEFEPLLSPEGMKNIAEYAVGIGPSIDNLVDHESTSASIRLTGLADWAHAEGLEIHAYTFRQDPDQVPAYVSDFDELLRLFFDDIGVDGVFTDFPDLAVRYVQENR